MKMEINGLDMQGLSTITFFSGLPVETIVSIGNSAHRLNLQEDQFAFYQDDPAERVFVLAAGRLKLSQLSPDGQQVIMRVATPWMLIAAVGIVSGAFYPVSAQAAEDSILLYWTQSEILQMIEKNPVLALNAMRLLSGHVREFQDRYRELATERVERRLARTILRLASQTGKKTDEGVLLNLPLSRQDLAEMTGTTLYTVSRILSAWEAQELVSVGRERVLIRFPHGLVRIAEDLPNPNKG